MKRFAAVIATFCLMIGPGLPAHAAECAAAAHPAGDWAAYGGDAANTRSQPLETRLNPATVGNLGVGWFKNLAQVQPGAAGSASTPVVVDGCVFVSDRAGYVFAFNADSGEKVWVSPKLPGAAQQLYSSVITGSPAVGDDLVYVGVGRENSSSHSYVAALDKATGAVVWTSRIPMFAPNGTELKGHTAIAAPVLYGDLLLQAISAPEGGSNARGGWAVLDATRAGQGQILARDYSVSDTEWNAGFRGASVWCTPALDVTEGFAYACGGNPANKDRESRNSNALLKIDMRPTVNASPNPAFGKLVDSYKGDVDQYYPGLDRQPVCDAFSGTIAVIWSQACVQLDLDFGSSPSLFTDSAGQKIVGDLQKSGIYHAVFADFMSRSWTAVIAPPCFFCNSSSPAVDGNNAYAAGSPPGQIFALSKDKGRTRWATPVGEVFQYQSVSVANGVVYTLDLAGTLIGLDAALGTPLVRKFIAQDTGTSVTENNSTGVAIARSTVYAAAGPVLIAYR